jgi:hypothetical protein
MTIQKSTNGNPERKIPNKSEMNPKIPRKFMINHNIHKKHHTKNHIIWNLFGMENQLIKLSKQRCDTHCHTYIHKIISQQSQMINMQNQHQNVQPEV